MSSNEETGSRTKLTLVIVNYNTRDFLQHCLKSIRTHAPDAQVIVVDNDSRDDSPGMVRREFPVVELIEMGRNAGFAAANNVGIAHARGDYIVLFNSDAALVDRALDRCVQWLDERPWIGAASPRLVGVDDQPQSCFYPFPRLSSMLREAFRLPPRSSHGDTEDEGWLAGTALVIRRLALESIGGGLDESFWMYWEDCDLSARLLAAGWRLAAFDGGWIRHHGGASGGGLDSNRRADLHAWYVYGKHHWFRKHRPRYEASVLWVLDALDVARKAIRGTIRSRRRGERVHAGVTGRVLRDRLRGVPPRVPGTAN